MYLIETDHLSIFQRKSILELCSSCKQTESISLSFPLDDDCRFFLGYKNRHLISALSLFFPEENVCECMAMTLPDYRRQGYFSALLERAMTFLAEDTELYFTIDHQSAHALATLNALACEFLYSEYMMSLPLYPTHEEIHPSAAIHVTRMENTYHASFHHTSIGICHILPQSSNVYLYGLEIKKSFRHQGYGSLFFKKILSDLYHRGFKNITLQVSGENIPALSLYQKTGFQISETLSYYLY